MAGVSEQHFKLAALEIGHHGDNDTLPFDIDNRFIKDKHAELAAMAYEYFCHLEGLGKSQAVKTVNSLQAFGERLLSPTGSAGFRVTTKIHPFWNIYLNGLGIAVAEALEPKRSVRAHSYRYSLDDRHNIFDREKSWRTFREATIADEALAQKNAVVVQTDVSSFYEHIYHHRLENIVSDLFQQDSTVPAQFDRFLSKLAAGRSFGLPVGGQCARILAEAMMSPIDQMLSDTGVIWHRYVDDFVLIANGQADAYTSLSNLSHALADYGLSLNRTKTTILSGNHYRNYVEAQLGGAGDEAAKLREIDLYFDPYSDAPEDDYDELQKTVDSIDVQALLAMELEKSQPDAFLVAQVGRILKLQPTQIALQLCETLLSRDNLHAFRASWSTIMRGIASLRADETKTELHTRLDDLLDAVPRHSRHLLLPETNALHYLKTIRFNRSGIRAHYVHTTYSNTNSETVKRACIDCWRNWKDRPSFVSMRNRWSRLDPQEQRMWWLSSYGFSDDGKFLRKQEESTLAAAWSLGIESNVSKTFADVYLEWVKNEF